jgi:hypothetical protein
MRRHFLARAMCRFKSINAAMVMLLVAIVSISAAHIAAAIFHSVPCSKYSKSRQATSTSPLLECAKGTLCGAKCAQAEPSPRERCRRPCSVPILPLSPATSGSEKPRARIGTGVQHQSAHDAPCACASATGTFSRSVLQRRADISQRIGADAMQAAVRKRTCFTHCQ